MESENKKNLCTHQLSGTAACIFKQIQQNSQHTSDHKDKCLISEKHLIKKRGEVIFTEGEDFENLFCVSKGLIKITRKHQGEHIILWIAKEGDLIGIQSFLQKKQYTYTAIAVSESELCVIPAQVFAQLLKEHNGLYLSLMQLINKRVDMMHSRLGKSKMLTDRL